MATGIIQSIRTKKASKIDVFIYLRLLKHQFDMDKDNIDDLRLLIETHGLQIQSLANISNYLLNKHPWDIAFIQAHMPDGINHALGAYLSTDAEKYTSKKNIECAYNIIKDIYITMDTFIGRICNECKKNDDYLAVVSDHGCLGAWKWVIGMGMLVKGSFTVFDKNPSPVVGFRYKVNLKKSKVFRGILSEHLFINLKGKFPNGIVEPKDYDKVRNELIEHLWSYKDPDTDQSPFYKIIKKEDAGYLGLFGEYIGDVLTYLKPKYYDGVHMANYFTQDYWDYISGDNVIIKKWGATHTPYHPDCTDGIMSSNAFFFLTGPNVKKGYRKKNSIHLVDVAPTIAYLAGIEQPKNADGVILEDFIEK